MSPLTVANLYYKCVSGKAEIRVDVERVHGTINPNIYGQMAEQLGRCIYGGIFEPESRFADKAGFRTDLIAAAKELAPPAPQKIAQGVSRTQPVATAAAQPKQSMPAAAEGEAVAERKVGVSNLPAAGVAELEKNAQDERHRGRYTLAASLYRRAAFVRGAGSAEGAWDLAHAIECLAAAGSFDEARQIRAELFRLHPNERTAYSAANRALREADAPGPPADQPALKAKAASEPDATLPVDH